MGTVDEIIVVDDGSTDRSYELMKEYDVKIVRHEHNLGKPAAINTGVMNAKGEILIFTDADNTYPAEYIPKFVEKIESGADLVLGSRFLDGIENMRGINIIGNKVLSLIAGLITGVSFSDSQTGYRAIRKDLYGNLNIRSKGLDFETKMSVTVAKRGYNIIEFPIKYRERIGESKLKPVRDGLRMFVAIISIIKEMSLLVRTILSISLCLFFIGLALSGITLYDAITLGYLTHGYYPLLAILFFFTSVQIISFGLILDYLIHKLGRIEEKIII